MCSDWIESIDDLIEYYSEFERMNLIPQINGLKIDDNIEGWFKNNGEGAPDRLGKELATLSQGDNH